jgi:putative SOS response-associated peptidase YedK
MCGRYVITKAASKTKNIIQKNNGVVDEINYNAFPGSVLPVITKEEDQLALHKFHWGLVPKWSEKMKDFKPLNNARLETIHEKVTFKGLIAARRCVVPADGYYEWRKDENDRKVPYYFTGTDLQTLYFAGLYQKNINTEFSIITTEAKGDVTEIHHRMPVILQEQDIHRYLDLKTDALTLLNVYPGVPLTFNEVSREVNNPANNTPELIQSL